MANSFSKEERVAFEDILEGFQDALVLSRNVAVFNTDQTMMERTNNILWRPQPYIATSYNGTDMSSNFDDFTQLAVPATIGFQKSVPWVMTATELRDSLQEGRLGDAAKQKLASDINVAIMNVAANQGTLFVKRTAAASGFDDVAQCEAIMNEQGHGRRSVQGFPLFRQRDQRQGFAQGIRWRNGQLRNLQAGLCKPQGCCRWWRWPDRGHPLIGWQLLRAESDVRGDHWRNRQRR